MAEQQNSKLTEKIVKLVQDNGPLPVETYMSLCLTDPEYGYYQNRDPLGAQGDFITAPEICQVFGELIGLWAAEVWRSMGEPSEVNLVELGPGRGTLMSDALRASRVLPAFYDAASVHLVDVNPALREIQKNTLASHADKLSWHEEIASLPARPSIIIANEFFDALPVQQFQLAEGKWFERCVSQKDGTAILDFTLGEDSTTHVEALLQDYDVHSQETFSSLKSEVIFEYRKNCLDVLSHFADFSKSNPVALLAIDYGHEASGFGDTLQAVRGHQFADPLINPGLADLTTQVDFNQLKKFSLKSGLNSYGPMTQGQFLLMLGLEARLNQLLQSASPEQGELLKSGAMRLVAPDQMGVLFKVMSITSPDLPKPPAFS